VFEELDKEERRLVSAREIYGNSISPFKIAERR